MIDAISHVNVWVEDQDEAKAFYTEKLGTLLNPTSRQISATDSSVVRRRWRARSSRRLIRY